MRAQQPARRYSGESDGLQLEIDACGYNPASILRQLEAMMASWRSGTAAVVCIGLGVAAVGVRAQGAKPAAEKNQHVMVSPSQLKWGPAPPALPAGAEATALDGDPTQKGPFVVRVKFPDGYSVPPHWHPTDENLVVLSGTLLMGVGEKADRASMRPMATGAYAKMPAGTRHYVTTKGETIVQIHGMGPFEINYVNPQDDPRKKTTAR